MNTIAQDLLNPFGIDAVCEAIAGGKTITALAIEIGVSKGALLLWLSSDAERASRSRDARASAACLWDETAEARLDQAKDAFELAKARDLAHHWRWRASKIAPKVYGDNKTDADAAGDGKVIFVTNSPDEG